MPSAPSPSPVLPRAARRTSSRGHRGRFPLTRHGWWFLGATVLVGLGALNAGLNLLFAMWGMMLFLVAASGVLSELGLRGLEIRRVPPPVIHAGVPYLMGIALSNRKRRLPSFSVEAEDLVDGLPIEKRCYFLKLPAGRTQETAYRHTIAHRGRHRLSGLRLSTKFPFGLLRKSRDVSDATEVIVYPALAPVPHAVLRALPVRHDGNRQKWRSRDGDFFGLRDFRPGDDPRDIHWRTTARRGVPFVRENEDDEGSVATVVLDNATSPVEPAAFELAVSQAAAFALELLRRGFRVRLVLRGATLAGDAGPAQVTRILRALALVEPADPTLPLEPRAPEGALVRVRPGAAPEIGGEPRARRSA
ncbi:MAG: hypothetical protein JWM82_308 [Myxococcales bacterium]|nr:hypothetical protein [Myxococcales bacterium]